MAQIIKVGNFYIAQLGNYYVAATFILFDFAQDNYLDIIKK